MKKTIFLIITLIITTGLTACASNENVPDNKAIASEKKQEKIIEKAIGTEKEKDKEIKETIYANNYEKLVNDVYNAYNILYGFGASGLIDENNANENDEYLPVIDEKFKDYTGWESYIKEIFEGKIAERILNNDVVTEKDNLTYVKSGHVPLYVEWNLAEDRIKEIKTSDKIIEVNMEYWADSYSEPTEEVLTIKYMKTDNGLIITGGTLIEKLFP